MIMTFCLGSLKSAAQRCAFVFKGEAAVAFVDNVSVEKCSAVLVDGRQAAVCQRGQHCRMDRMDVHGAAGMLAGAVQAAV